MGSSKPPAKSPTFIIENPKPASFSGIIIDIDYWEPDKETLLELTTTLTEGYFTALKEKIIAELPTLMTFANFLGEAETYMYQNNIPYTNAVRQKYAIAIHGEFIAAVDKLIEYDGTENAIYLSPYVYSLEYGDFYRPALGFLTTCLKAWIEQIESGQA